MQQERRPADKRQKQLDLLGNARLLDRERRLPLRRRWNSRRPWSHRTKPGVASCRSARSADRGVGRGHLMVGHDPRRSRSAPAGRRYCTGTNVLRSPRGAAAICTCAFLAHARRRHDRCDKGRHAAGIAPRGRSPAGPHSTPANSPWLLKIGPPESPCRAATDSSTISYGLFMAGATYCVHLPVMARYLPDP